MREAMHQVAQEAAKAASMPLRQLSDGDVVESLHLAHELPEHGGEPPQVTVTVPYDPVAATLNAGRLDNGTRVFAATVRRQACDARILPVVLGGPSQVIDVGRSRRLVSGLVAEHGTQGERHAERGNHAALSDTPARPDQATAALDASAVTPHRAHPVHAAGQRRLRAEPSLGPPR